MYTTTKSYETHQFDCFTLYRIYILSFCAEIQLLPNDDKVGHRNGMALDESEHAAVEYYVDSGYFQLR